MGRAARRVRCQHGRKLMSADLLVTDAHALVPDVEQLVDGHREKELEQRDLARRIAKAGSGGRDLLARGEEAEQRVSHQARRLLCLMMPAAEDAVAKRAGEPGSPDRRRVPVNVQVVVSGLH